MTTKLKERRVAPDKYEAVRNQHVSLAQHAYQISKAIKDPESLSIAAKLLMSIKEKRKMWKDMFSPVVSAAFQAHRKSKEFENEIDRPLKQAEMEFLKPAIAQFRTIEDEQRRKKEAELKKDTGVDIVLQSQSKVPGITYKTEYFAEVTDLKALLKGVLEGHVPHGAVFPNMPLLNSMARNLKTGLNWPGVTVKSKQGVSSRSTT